MRNFGLSNVTSPTTVGGNQSPGSHLREELTRNSIIQLADHVPPDNSGRGNAAPFSPDVRERAACFFILAFVTLVCSILLASYVALSSLNLD